jgi:hypothetical protein
MADFCAMDKSGGNFGNYTDILLFFYTAGIVFYAVCDTDLFFNRLQV